MLHFFNSQRERVKPYTFTINTYLGNGSTTFQLPTSTTRMQNFLIDWGDGLTEVLTGVELSGYYSHSYTVGGIYTVKIYPRQYGYPIINWNNKTDAAKVISVNSWGNSPFLSLSLSFYGCINLTSVPLSNIPFVNQSGVANSMYRDCASLTTIPQVDTIGITTMQNMLQNSGIKQDLSWLRIENCTSFSFFLNGADVNNSGTTINYDALLNSIAAQSYKPNVSFNGGTSKYSAAASAARTALIAAGWTISDGGLAP